MKQPTMVINKHIINPEDPTEIYFHIVNELDDTKAQIAKLKEHEDFIKNKLIEFGEGTYHGDQHDVTVTEIERKTLNMKAVKQKLSRQFISANTKTTKFICVKIFGRKESK